MSTIKELLSKENLRTAFGRLLHSHRRFPLALLSAFVLATLLIYSISQEDDQVFEGLIETISTFVLGIPLMFSLELLAERKWWNKWMLLAGGLFVLVIYFFTTEFHPEDNENIPFLIRFLGLALIFHLMVSVLPYLKVRDQQKFWNFNKTLFLSILISALYSATLLAGLNLAILAIDQLFEANIDGKVYGYVAVFIGTYVNTTLFANNVPNLEEIDNELSYPKGLKLFTQYVLLPLVAIYLIILLSYEVKILLQWELPKGWVSNLVLASGVFGVLAFLLLYPIKNSSSWVGRFNKLYYWILLPLIVLMMVAIYVRIDQYGVTEPRYLVAILACWLLGISLYFIISSKDEIWWIPLSLIAVAFIATFGPLSSISVAERNQERRMTEVLNKYNLLPEGKLVKNSEMKLTTEDADKLSGGLDYLSRRRPEVILAMLSEDDQKTFMESIEYNRKDLLWDWMTLEKTATEQVGDQRTINVYRQRESLEKAFNADYVMEVYPSGKDWSMTSSIDSVEIKVMKVGDTKLRIEIEDEELIFDFLEVFQLPGEVKTEKLTFESGSTGWKGILILNSFYKKGDKGFSNFDGKIYLIRKGD
ncbi:DUF4153 domain-containing protein [Jiulongibacter sediminis]|uniref:DUF4153 domain-containing protein n=1 Tax=Jiulongibacter sediminis TaxID=1605367 RepID=UPI0006DCAFBD|nr:DUF4153 domain-containing protein [Jiulongibacter sediminis]